VRAVLALAALATAGCAELGVVTDGSSISFGRPSRGYLIDGVKLPDKGDGFTTRETWSLRGNRYGTDELVALLKGVAKRMKKKAKDARLVIADLSNNGGGAALEFHRSHQSGRDVDILYYMRDIENQPVEPEAMIVVDRRLRAVDLSGMTIDVPRTWQLVKELLTAEEAMVQYIFMYQPIAEALIVHARAKNEDPVLIMRAMRACKQPGDSAPHNDHMHVRIYCADTDRQFGCVDIGALELLAERQAEKRKTLQMIADALPRAAEPEEEMISAADVWAANTSAAIATRNGTLGSVPDGTLGSTPVASTPLASTPVASTPVASTPLASTPVVSTTVASTPVPSANASSAVPVPSALSLPNVSASSSSQLPSASFNSLFRARTDRVDLRGWR
jgi:penicillin-insensitive murein endopeptidase